MTTRLVAARAIRMSAVLALLATLVFSSVALAANSRILSVTYLSDPSIVDVTVTGISFDAGTGEVTVTGSFRCDPGFDLWFVDFAASQARGSASRVGESRLWLSECNGNFTTAITAAEGTFRPGRVTIDIAALACGRRCGEELVRVEAVLVP